MLLPREAKMKNFLTRLLCFLKGESTKIDQILDISGKTRLSVGAQLVQLQSMIRDIADLKQSQGENKMAVQAVLDKITAADTKLDAQAIVITDTKTEIDALKALIASGGDLTQVSAAVDDLAARVDAHGTALDDLKTDAAG